MKRKDIFKSSISSEMRPQLSQLKVDIKQIKKEAKQLQEEMELGNSAFNPEITDVNGNSNSDDSWKKSLKSHATDVFQDSTIGMLSSIITIDSIYRKFFKVFVFALCFAGFVYQSVAYMNHVLEYPTYIDIAVERPERINAPAYTFCTNNPVKRSVFCSLNSSYCLKPSEEFCKTFESYCGANETLIPKKEYYILKNVLSFKDTLKYGVDYDEISQYTSFPSVPSDRYLQMDYSTYELMLCYRLNSVVESNEQPQQRERDVSTRSFEVELLVFHTNESEMLVPGRLPTITFAVHSPFDAENMFEKGFRMKLGKEYEIEVKIEGEILLKHPFKTNCKDYEEVWRKNNHTGPRSQEMCYAKCLIDHQLAGYNCTLSVEIYPSKEKVCEKEDYTYKIDNFKREERQLVLSKCQDSCQEDYRLLTYTSEIKEKEIQGMKLKEHLRNKDIRVSVRLPNIIRMLQHSPKYQTVEVVSNIGGFIGIWLGIALMDIIDVMGCIITVCRRAFTKK